MQIDLEAKNLLAKLLASENIWVRHAKVETASFDLAGRILIFPMWADMSDVLYTMLAGHEVGHALYSYDLEKGKRVNANVASYGKRIDPDPNNLHLACQYWNIVEDARIERLIKTPYPGLKSVFGFAYQELYDKNIFGIKDTNVSVLPLIDRINLYFKIGHLVHITFSIDEEVLVRKVETTLTMDNVLDVAKEIYDWSKQNEIQPPPPITMKMSMKEFEKMMKTMEPCSNSKGQKIIITIEDAEEGDENETKKTKDTEETEETDKGVENSESKTQPKKTSTGFEITKPVDPTAVPPAPTTQQTFDNRIAQYQDPNATEIIYVTLPTPNLKNIIVDYPEVHQKIQSYYAKSSTDMKQAESEFAAFSNTNMPKINYILQQFEMKKQADRYKRTKQHKTGALDTLRLHSYKTEEDLFKTISVINDGKNHGLIFVVDWSGSMSGCMAGTLEQLIILCLFCRRAQIPFEVYSLTTGGRNAFSRQPGNLVYASNFRMRNYLSSRMGPAVFQQSCINLFALMPEGRFKGGYTDDNLTCCTPLDEAIITTIDLIQGFKKRTNAQIVNAIFLTDGGANTVGNYINDQGKDTSMYGYNRYNYGSNYNQNTNSNTRFIIDDRLTHKTYQFSSRTSEMTPTMVKILRDRNNIHAVCFYIGGSWEYFVSETTKHDTVKNAAMTKDYSENGYVISTEWGFDEMYLIKDGGMLRIKDVALKPHKLVPGTQEYMDEMQKNFIKRGQTMQKQRILLNRFVDMIA